MLILTRILPTTKKLKEPKWRRKKYILFTDSILKFYFLNVNGITRERLGLVALNGIARHVGTNFDLYLRIQFIIKQVK